MIGDGQVRSIALFFLLTVREEKLALEAAHRAVGSLKAVRSRDGAVLSDVDLIRTLKKFSVVGIQRRQISRSRNLVTPEESVLKFADGIDSSAWLKFQKQAGENELIAVTLSRILDFSEESIATALGLSLGTVRYRIGKGMRQLGASGQKGVRT